MELLQKRLEKLKKNNKTLLLKSPEKHKMIKILYIGTKNIHNKNKKEPKKDKKEII